MCIITIRYYSLVESRLTENLDSVFHARTTMDLRVLFFYCFTGKSRLYPSYSISSSEAEESPHHRGIYKRPYTPSHQHPITYKPTGGLSDTPSSGNGSDATLTDTEAVPRDVTQLVNNGECLNWYLFYHFNLSKYSLKSIKEKVILKFVLAIRSAHSNFNLSYEFKSQIVFSKYPLHNKFNSEEMCRYRITCGAYGIHNIIIKSFTSKRNYIA